MTPGPPRGPLRYPGRRRGRHAFDAAAPVTSPRPHLAPPGHLLLALRWPVPFCFSAGAKISLGNTRVSPSIQRQAVHVFAPLVAGHRAISACVFCASFQKSGRACRKLETIRSLLVDGALRSQPAEKLTIARRIRRKSYLVAEWTNFVTGNYFWPRSAELLQRIVSGRQDASLQCLPQFKSSGILSIEKANGFEPQPL